MAYVEFGVRYPDHLQIMFSGLVGRHDDYPELKNAGQEAYELLASSVRAAMQAGLVSGPSEDIVSLTSWALVHGLALLIAPFIVAFKQPDPEKLSAYECGFNAFDDARMKFDVRFYLVSILFIIFDLEVAFLFPWAVTLGKIGLFGFWSMMAFLAVLTIGFIYEWRKGALEWD